MINYEFFSVAPIMIIHHIVEDIVNETMITPERVERKNNTVLDKQGVSPIAKYTIDGWDGKQTEFSKQVKILFNNKLYT